MNVDNNQIMENLFRSRAKLPWTKGPVCKVDEEGGCGVTGFIASIPVRGRNIFEPSVQMHNRGNGKGGGIAAVGLCADDLGIDQDVLDSHYLLQIAYLDGNSRPKVEASNVEPFFDVHRARRIPTIDDYRDIDLEVKPPDIWQYFVKVKPDVLSAFAEENSLTAMEPGPIEDEFVYQNTIRLNQTYYASLGNKEAFVMSHGRNLMILKIVGYAEKVTQYYCLDDFRAHGWIAHQRYPTRGRLWHPGGAHPFSGMHEALVHNGDFANYHAVSEYLHMHHIHPQFLTDTEVSVLLLDLFNRSFDYPLEYIIEALAPTTEYDFDQLPVEKQRIYRYIQSQHTAGSPDGPWFFIIARNDPYKHFFQLIGITDTAMLRPQVFALQEREDVQIGLVCSEKQAIDATLSNLAAEDDRFCTIADKYWNARGGSASDGGAFMFTVKDSGKKDGSKTLVATNKFGDPVTVPEKKRHFNQSLEVSSFFNKESISQEVKKGLRSDDLADFKAFCLSFAKDEDFNGLSYLINTIVDQAGSDDKVKANAIDLLTHMNDGRYPVGDKKQSSVLEMIRQGLSRIFAASPGLNERKKSRYGLIDWDARHHLRAPEGDETVLVVNAEGFQPEGRDCDSRLMNKAYRLGWDRFICYGYRGQRFTGNGFGPDSDRVRIDVYDSSGDYLASGIDGMEIYVHGNGQDQIGQIMKRGKLVVHGDVGQTFMYGAKGGDVYVLGNAAGRPLINATGHPRVVINGTCLDYLAESFMAGDPLNGGGFVVLNGITFDENGKLMPQETPYPGSNLFSLASGGAIYLRDPEKKVVEEQLNGGEFVDLSDDDWALILPYLKENEKHFGILIDDLLTVNGTGMEYNQVFRKVQAVKLQALGTADEPQELDYPQEWDDDGECDV